MPDERTLQAYIIESRTRFESWLGQMVEIPSISMLPDRAGDIRRMAEWARQALTALGADATIVETPGAPVVAGGWTQDARYPTVTIYNHLDVQPAQEPEWKGPPFAFRADNGVYHGRGATDDKGPALTALLAGRYAIQHGIKVNIRFLWELEEEIGSPHFAVALARRGAIPAPDSVLVSDTIWVARDRPAVPHGLRGLLGARLILRTGENDAHSGVTGGAARNPLAELCDLVTRCVDAKTGKVKIPGFYDDVVAPTKAELDGFVRSGFQINRFMQAYGFRSLRSKDPREVLRRIWGAPTFEVHGLVGGYTGPGVKTVVPGYGELKVSMRLVPDQKPEKVFDRFKKFVIAQNREVKVEPEGMLEPFKGVSAGPYADAVRRAVKAGFGKPPVFIREGGSIGAVMKMQQAWGVPILFMGLSLPEHGYHAPNEHFDWGQASGGMKAFVAYFQELENIGKAPSGRR